MLGVDFQIQTGGPKYDILDKKISRNSGEAEQLISTDNFYINSIVI